MKTQVILSTRNETKAEQIKAIFAGSPVRILTLDEAGISGEAIENGKTLEENAYKKALYAHGMSKIASWTMADDTGFFIDALNGEPGIKAARWAGDVSTEEIMLKLLDRLAGTKNRRAYFETAVVLVIPDGSSTFTFSGRVHGTILEAPRCPLQPKMPYSAIFVPDGTNKV